MFKLAYFFASKVVGISSAVTNWLVKSGEVPAHKAIKIYNPDRTFVKDVTTGISPYWAIFLN